MNFALVSLAPSLDNALSLCGKYVCLCLAVYFSLAPAILSAKTINNTILLQNIIYSNVVTVDSIRCAISRTSLTVS